MRRHLGFGNERGKVHGGSLETGARCGQRRMENALEAAVEIQDILIAF